jgi:hypothetical protein
MLKLQLKLKHFDVSNEHQFAFSEDCPIARMVKELIPNKEVSEGINDTLIYSTRRSKHYNHEHYCYSHYIHDLHKIRSLLLHDDNPEQVIRTIEFYGNILQEQQ